MKKRLLRWINIQEAESSKIFYFFLFSMFIQVGVVIGESVANAMFLVTIGIEKLSIIYMITPFIILFLYMPIYSFFKSRYGEKSFFTSSLILLISVNVFIYLFVANASNFIAKDSFEYIYYFILLYTTIMVITLYTLVWNFIDSFFDTLDSKRVFSIFSAGTAIGAILGGVIVSTVSQHFSANILFLFWSLFSLFSLFTLLKISSSFTLMNKEEEEKAIPISRQLLAMFHTIRSSTYVMVLLSVFFISVLLAIILEYEYLEILSQDQSIESLALLFGQLYIIVNIFNLIVNVFLFNRLVIRFGVKNVLLIQPIAYLLVFSYLSVSIGIEAGILGFFIVQGLLVSIDYNNQNLLYNAINTKIKYKVRTFIENLLEPFAMAVAGLILFSIGADYSISQVAYITLLIAVVYVVLALILKYKYPLAMIRKLKDNWLDLTDNEIHIIENIPLAERKQVSIYLNKTNAPLITRIMCSYDEENAIEILLNYLNKSDESVYYKSELLLQELLNASNPKVLNKVIHWLENNDKHLNIILKKELGGRGFIASKHAPLALENKNIHEVSATSLSLLNSQYPHDFSRAISKINILLHSHKTEEIIEGLYLLGKSKHRQYVFYVASFLKHSEEVIVSQALDTIYQLADHHMNNLSPDILEIFINGSKSQRLLSIKVLARIKDTSSIIRLFDRIETVSIYEKYEIMDMIMTMGLQSIPALVRVLLERKYSYFAKSIAGRCLGRLDFSQFKDIEKGLILREIESIYKLLYIYHIVLEEYHERQDDRLLLLCKYFQDKHQFVLEFVLEILSIGGSIPSAEGIKTSIRSRNINVRDNVVETIEQSTEWDIFRILLPLLDGRDIEDIIYFYQKNYTVFEYDLEAILEYSIYAHHELEVAIAITLIPTIHSNPLEIFRQKLLSTKSIKIKKMIFASLNSEKCDNSIFTLAKVSHYKSMSYFNIFVLYIMLEEAKIIQYTVSKNEESMITGISILLNGVCSRGKTIYTKGDFIDFSIIFSPTKEKNKSVKHSEEIEILQIQKSALLNAIEIYPEIGIGFLK
jgi:MFS family permease